MWIWVVAELVCQGLCCDCPPQAMGGTSFPTALSRSPMRRRASSPWFSKGQGWMIIQTTYMASSSPPLRLWFCLSSKNMHCLVSPSFPFLHHIFVHCNGAPLAPMGEFYLTRPSGTMWVCAPILVFFHMVH